MYYYRGNKKCNEGKEICAKKRDQFIPFYLCIPVHVRLISRLGAKQIPSF